MLAITIIYGQSNLDICKHKNIRLTSPITE